MRAALCEEIANQKSNAATPFAKNLAAIKVDGRGLEELLTEADLADLPYNVGRRWRKELGENIEEFLEDIGDPKFLMSSEAQDALFYAYWHSFFRFGRKSAAGKGGGD